MANNAKTKAQAPKSSRKIGKWLGIALLLVAIVALPILQAKRMVNQAMVDLLGTSATYTIGSSRPTTTGAVASNIVVNTRGAPIRISQLTINASTLWMLMASYNIPGNEPDMKKVRIEYRGIDNPEGLALGGWDASSGPVTAALMETQGCGKKTSFSTSDFGDMGLAPGETKVVHEYESKGDTLYSYETTSTDSLGSSTVVTGFKGQRTGVRLDFKTGRNNLTVSEQSWSYQDDGFISRRNEYCAKLMNVSVDQFLTYHAAAVDRVLRSVGLRANADMWNLYMSYAREGKKLTISGNYAVDLSSAWWSLAWFDKLTNITADATIAATTVPLKFAQQEAQPFAEADELLSTYDVMQKEGGIKAASVQDVIAAAASEGNQAAAETVVVKGDAGPERSDLVFLYRNEPEYINTYEGLASVRGRRVMIERQNGENLVAIVKGVNAQGGILLHVYKKGGYADLVFDRHGFKRALLLPN